MECGEEEEGRRRRCVAALWLLWENGAEMMRNNVAPSHLNSSDSRPAVHIPPLCRPPAERHRLLSAAENREVPGTSLDLGTFIIFFVFF